MDAYTIDPRDTTWEVDLPAYRVYFWHDTMSDEYRVTGVEDVREVLAWADAQAGSSRMYTLYVEHLANVGLGLIKLAGVDPTVLV